MNPVAKIYIQGVSAPEVNKRIMSVKITDNAATNNDVLEVELEDADRIIQLPNDGDEMVVELGYEPLGDNINPPDSAPRPMGVFRLDELKWGGPPDTLTLVGHAHDTGSSFKSQWSGEYKGLFLGDVVTQVATRNGLIARVHKELGIQLMPYLYQKVMSDMAFLANLSEQVNAEMKVSDGCIYFAPFGRMTEIGLTLGPSRLAVPESCLITYHYLRNSRTQYGSVAVGVENTDEGTTTTQEADSDPESDPGEDDGTQWPVVMQLPANTPSPTMGLLYATSKAQRLKNARHTLTCSCLGDPRVLHRLPQGHRGKLAHHTGRSSLYQGRLHHGAGMSDGLHAVKK